MAVCRYCNQEMTAGAGCVDGGLVIFDRPYRPIRWGDEDDGYAPTGVPCRDCGVPVGGIHHPGCCVERCPACLGQLISCDCRIRPYCSKGTNTGVKRRNCRAEQRRR